MTISNFLKMFGIASMTFFTTGYVSSITDNTLYLYLWIIGLVIYYFTLELSNERKKKRSADK